MASYLVDYKVIHDKQAWAFPEGLFQSMNENIHSPNSDLTKKQWIKRMNNQLLYLYFKVNIFNLYSVLLILLENIYCNLVQACSSCDFVVI